MTKNCNAVKRDLIYIYSTLYKSVNENNELFDKKLANRFKYTPEEIEQVLEIDNRVKEKKSPTKENVTKDAITKNIRNLDELRTFYYSDLKKLYDNTLDEKVKEDIINSVSLNELKRLHAIIFNVSITKGTTKKEIIDMMRYYFNDEARTDSLIKTM